MPRADTPGETAAAAPGGGPCAPVPPKRPGLGLVLKWAAVIAVVLFVWLHWNGEIFREWKEQARPLPFFIALAILPAVGVPTTPFYILAGAAFPVPVALGGSLAALVVNLLICYAISTGPLRRFFVGWIERRAYQLPDLREKGAWRFSMVVKFMPGVPAFAKNYLLGIAGVPFAIYMLVSVLSSGFYLTGFVVLGESAMDRNAGKAAIALGVLLLAAVVVWQLRRRREIAPDDHRGPQAGG